MFQPTMEVNIHNQCSDFKLRHNAFFSTCGTTDDFPAWEVDTGNMSGIELIYPPATFEGVLSYVLKRKHVGSNEQFESIHIRLFVAWKSEGYKNLRACVNLVEYDEKFNWNNTKLEEYCQRCVSQLSTYTDTIKDTWLIRDGTVLMTRLELDFTQRDGVLNIIVSEGVKDDHTKRPVWIDSKR
jgi:hypothetical protein